MRANSRLPSTTAHLWSPPKSGRMCSRCFHGQLMYHRSLLHLRTAHRNPEPGPRTQRRSLRCAGDASQQAALLGGSASRASCAVRLTRCNLQVRATPLSSLQHTPSSVAVHPTVYLRDISSLIPLGHSVGTPVTYGSIKLAHGPFHRCWKKT